MSLAIPETILSTESNAKPIGRTKCAVCVIRGNGRLPKSVSLLFCQAREEMTQATRQTQTPVERFSLEMERKESKSKTERCQEAEIAGSHDH